jgi:hypothetical protein
MEPSRGGGTDNVIETMDQRLSMWMEPSRGGGTDSVIEKTVWQLRMRNGAKKLGRTV